jgi:hypothetical protein
MLLPVTCHQYAPEAFTVREVAVEPLSHIRFEYPGMVVEVSVVLVPQSLTLIVAGDCAETLIEKKQKSSPNAIGAIISFFFTGIAILPVNVN